jgi:UDP-N-acetylmuramoyl-L-alanyl-D-glutamate--2,6-diaminopimelate ligase
MRVHGGGNGTSSVMKLTELCSTLADATLPPGSERIAVRAVRDDSREVKPGDVFVAIPGTRDDGRDHAAQAAAAGAAAIVSDVPLDVPVPVVVVGDARRALAELAATSLGRPAARLVMTGITGTLGKTSVLMMLREILAEARIPAGTVGSLGIEHPGGGDATPNTTPGALTLQQAMADMVAAGTRVLAMEVTSHALEQGRVHGMMYDLGIFTNLAMLEHLEYHGSFAAYVEAKRAFFDHLAPTAPLVYAVGNPPLRQLVRTHPGPLIAAGGGGGAQVTVRRGSLKLAGTRVRLTVRRPLPRVHAPPLEPLSMSLQLRTPGRSGISNATLAAVGALCLGADPDAVRAAIERHEPPRRRLQLIRAADPTIIDDTVGHPDSVTGVFEVVAGVPRRRLNIAFCIRGQRGPVINALDADALAIWSRQVPIDALHLTSATDTADARNTVTAEERDAFLAVLDRAGLRYTHHERLRAAIDAVLDVSGSGDVVLLLGAQGMDAGAELALQRLNQSETDARISRE